MMKSFVFSCSCALMLSLMVCGCSRNASDDLAEAADQKPLEVQVGGSLFEPQSEEFMQRYQPDIQMSARWEGDSVWVAVLNRTDQKIRISAANFGVVLDGKLHRVTRESALAKFPVTDLVPGASATGSIRFLRLGDLTGKKLVFYHPPEVQPSMCVIGSKSISTPSNEATDKTQ